LTGHLNSITDIAYSHGGDRILTASQKDGVLRIWAWGKESKLNFKTRRGSRQQNNANTHLTQILIRLTDESTATNNQQNIRTQNRRRGGSRNNTNSNSGSSNVHCDVAVWSSDDKTVITSQTIPAKVNTNEIVPGSNVIHIWDSFSGMCLLGIFGAHESACPLLAVHPNDSSILASGGADGLIHVWDLDTGKSFFEYKNILKYGTSDNSILGKNCGFLDGSFSPDGLTLVLTDDSGCITILDTQNRLKRTKSSQEKSGDSLLRLRHDGLLLTGEVAMLEDTNSFSNNEFVRLHSWMTEQYFANDYYDLEYDVHGYALERGSGAPPHLAPRASRCNHTGTAVSAQINIGFLKIKGPLPLSESQCRWNRHLIQSNLKLIKRNECEVLERNVAGKKAISIKQSLGSTQRIYFNPQQDKRSNSTQPPPRPSTTNSERQPVIHTTSSLRSNIRYRDDDDVQEHEEVDDNDEDFVLPSNGNRFIESSSEEEFDEDELVDVDTPNSRRGSGGRRSNLRQNRSNQRLGSSIRNSNSEERSNRRRQRRHIGDLREEFVARMPIQASRTSSRSAARNRRTYEESDEDSNVDDQFLMKKNKSHHTLPYREDYTKVGHFFYLPSGGLVERDWITREESMTSYCGQKPYAPQVGDKVVYIPRAHYDTLNKFPGTNDTTPWKSFPQNREWSIVQCVIKKIRYRFPYESYYRKAREKGDCCRSVVAIVTLEVIGIPRTQQRDYPWMDTTFISIESLRTRSSSLEEFEVRFYV